MHMKYINHIQPIPHCPLILLFLLSVVPPNTNTPPFTFMAEVLKFDMIPYCPFFVLFAELLESSSESCCLCLYPEVVSLCFSLIV
jgi:hypothetical protein